MCELNGHSELLNHGNDSPELGSGPLHALGHGHREEAIVGQRQRPRWPRRCTSVVRCWSQVRRSLPLDFKCCTCLVRWTPRSERYLCFPGCRRVQGDPALLPPVRAGVLHLRHVSWVLTAARGLGASLEGGRASLLWSFLRTKEFLYFFLEEVRLGTKKSF